MASQTFQLVMHSGPNPGKIFELVQDELTIGRDIGNRIVINDPEVSRKHARLTMQSGGFVIEDLGSTNGTFVNNQRLIGPHMLRPGETIMLGEKISLEYEILGFDPNATMVSGAGPQAVPAPSRKPTALKLPTLATRRSLHRLNPSSNLAITSRLPPCLPTPRPGLQRSGAARPIRALRSSRRGL